MILCLCCTRHLIFDIRTGVGEFCENTHVLRSNSVIGLSFTHSALRITFSGVILATLLCTPNMFQWHRRSEAPIAPHTCSFQLFMEMRTSSHTKTRTVELSSVVLITSVWIRGWRCRKCLLRFTRFCSFANADRDSCRCRCSREEPVLARPTTLSVTAQDHPHCKVWTPSSVSYLTTNSCGVKTILTTSGGVQTETAERGGCRK